MKVKTVSMTCGGCPSQWDIYTEDNTYYYVRYRFGHFRVDKGSVGGDTVISKDYGGAWDGVMDTSEMKELTAEIFDWSE